MRNGMFAGAAAAALISATTASAGLVTVVSDDFSSYNTGAIVPQVGAATGWATSASTPGFNHYGWRSATSTVSSTNNTPTNVQVTNPGGAYSDGQRAEVLESAGNGGVAYRDLATPMVDAAGNTYYFSFNAENTNGGTRYFGVSLNVSGSEKTLMGQASTYSTWTMGGAAGVSTVSSSDPALLMAKIVFGGAGVGEEVTFWVNPDLTKPENDSANNAAKVVTFTLADVAGNINRLRIGGGNSNTTDNFAAHWLDNLLIQQAEDPSVDTPFNGIPEPTGLALLGAGAAFGLVRRRR